MMVTEILSRRPAWRGLGYAGIATFFLLFQACGAREKEAKPERPNIILITVDDLGWADLGCYGSTYYETPNIDRLAREGMRFTQAYASAAVCSPTRAALMTGKSPARLRLTDWIRARFQGGEIPEDKSFRPEYTSAPEDSLLCPQNPLWMELGEVTLAERLRETGYITAHIGKWHLGPDDWYPEKQGFDINIGGCDYGQPPSYFDPYVNKRLQGIPGLPARKEGEYLVDRLADEAAAFIVEHQNEPFFLNMADYAVHTPIQGRPDLVEKYKKKDTTHQDNPAYAAMVESTDMLAGRIMHVLDSLGIAQNTLLIFNSDNGGLLPITDNSPLRSGKGFPYEGGIRIPLIVRYPGKIPANSTSEVPVISHDWVPTICDILGLDLSGEEGIDGISIKPLLLEGEASLPRESLYWHFPHYRKEIVPYSIIREGDWKLIKRYEGKRVELFNLKEDPSESRDLALDQAGKAAELDARLSAWLGETGALLPKRKK